jgi:hypothetical protein
LTIPLGRFEGTSLLQESFLARAAFTPPTDQK